MKSFVIGEDDRGSIRCSVLSYEGAQTGEYYDDNWLLCEVEICAGAFSGKFTASFLTVELHGLLENLGKLYRDLHGSYNFEAIEGQLSLSVSFDSLGHFHLACEAMDQPGIGNKLSFNLSVDQTYLGRTLQELTEVVHTFPVRA